RPSSSCTTSLLAVAVRRKRVRSEATRAWPSGVRTTAEDDGAVATTSPEISFAPGGAGTGGPARSTVTVPDAITRVAMVGGPASSGGGGGPSGHPASAAASARAAATARRPPRGARAPPPISAVLAREIDVEDRLVSVRHLHRLGLANVARGLEDHRVLSAGQAHREAAVGPGAGADLRLRDLEERRDRLAAERPHLA